MTRKVVVWGTGNVGRPAIRAVIAHTGLTLAGVVVSNPDKDGVDAGVLAGIAPVGIKATRDWQSLLKSGVDAVVYAANADTRAEAAFMELVACLDAGVNVVSTAFYPLLYPPVGLAEAVTPIDQLCQERGCSVFISGIDPGWAMDILPVMLSGVVASIRQIRCQEIFNYALYDQPTVVREVIGFGQSMQSTPRMLEEMPMKTVWEPMVRIVADKLGVALDAVETHVERRPLEQAIEVPGMGVFEQGTQGAFRFEVKGMVAGKPRIVVEHVTRIDDKCAPDWPYPPEGQGCHRVIIQGDPDLHVTTHAHDHYEQGPAGGGNATAANRIVNAIEAVCAGKSGILSPLDLPEVTGKAQWAQ